MHRIFRIAFWLILLGSFFSACDSNKSGKEYSFERSVQEAIIEKRCVEGTPDSIKECYLLKWRNPVDTADLLRVHVWIDTMVIDSNDESVSEDARNASIKKDFTGGTIFYDSLDLTAALKAYRDRDDTVQIALWAEYDDDGSAGRIVRTFVLLGDDISPARVQVSEEVTHNTIRVRWSRPIDQTDFYKPEFLSGPIYGYNVVFRSTSGIDLTKAKCSLSIGGIRANTSKLISQKQWTYQADTITLADAKDKADDRHFAVRDSLGFKGDSTDQFELTISGLGAESQYLVSIETYDIASNYSKSEDRYIFTTDSVVPLRPVKFWFRLDTLDPGRVALDSNRVFLYWVRPVDPLVDESNITIGDSVFFPKDCIVGKCYRSVKTYFVETLDRGEWKPVRTGDLSPEFPTWALKGGVMKVDPTGRFVGDTLKWVAPGDTLHVRMRVQDSSGAYSDWLEDTLYVSRGSMVDVGCPAGFQPVARRKGADTTLSSKVCVERFEHRDSNGEFLFNVLYSDARQACRDFGTGYPDFSFDLCSEDDWLSACLSRNSSYGTIQEYPFEPQEFLWSECNQGTGELASALDLQLRSSRCTSPDGVHDLPGQLQEWARGTLRILDTLKSGKVDTLIDTVGILKGSSYVVFQTADRTMLARCGAVATPTRLRPRFTRDSVFLYQNGTRLDTLQQRDTTRKIYSALGPSSFRDEIRLYEVLHPQSKAVLGEDYVSQEEFDRRGGDAYVEILANGLEYRFVGKDTVLLLPGQVSSPDARNFYRENSVGFRCCAVPY